MPPSDDALCSRSVFIVASLFYDEKNPKEVGLSMKGVVLLHKSGHSYALDKGVPFPRPGHDLLQDSNLN